MAFGSELTAEENAEEKWDDSLLEEPRSRRPLELCVHASTRALLLGGLVVARPGVGRHAQPLGVHEGQGEGEGEGEGERARVTVTRFRTRVCTWLCMAAKGVVHLVVHGGEGAFLRGEHASLGREQLPVVRVRVRARVRARARS
eukprot:scaffold37625_cov55-Phaeocystis_antarctica.AAC.1